jgi:hypothetical protein
MLWIAKITWSGIPWIGFGTTIIPSSDTVKKTKNKNQFPFAIIVVNKTVTGFLKVPNWQTAQPNK